MGKKESNELMLALMESRNHAFIVLDKELRFVSATESANRLLNTDGPVILRNRVLVVDDVSDSKKFQESLNLVKSNKCSDVIFLTRAKERKPMRVEFHYMANRIFSDKKIEPAIIVLLNGLQYACSFLLSHFQSFYDLTNAEASVAESVFQGRTLSEHATRNCITINTVRGYLKGVFSKTGVASQAELKTLTNIFSS